MPITLLECQSIIGELQQAIVGGWIQKIHQPHSNTITLEIRIPGETVVLLICVEPRFARFHFTSQRYDNPPAPPPFCQFLRAHLEGGRIQAISQEPGDRVGYVTIERGNDRFILVLAMTGNQSNVYVLKEPKEVIQTLRVSWVKIGDQYVPPNRDKGERSANALHEKRDKIASDLGNALDLPLSHAFSEERSTPKTSSIPLGSEVQSNRKTDLTFSERFPHSAELEERFWQQEQDQTLAQIRQAQLSRVKKALKQTKRKIQGLEEDLRKAQSYQEYGRYGELLKGQIQTCQKGQAFVTVVDYYDPSLPKLTLPLDSSKDLVWNMENYFRKHRKFLAAEQHLRPRLKTATQEALRLQEELTKIESGEEPVIEVLPALSPNRREKRSMSDFSPKKIQQTRPLATANLFLWMIVQYWWERRPKITMP